MPGSAPASDADQLLARRAAVLALLRQAGDGRLSGQEIAQQLGISRTAVSNHIAALRREGYRIDSATRVGYDMSQSADLPLPWEVCPLLTGGFRQVTGGAETGSTNDDALDLARKGAPEGTVVLAARQTKGRGRLGRTWKSPEGGLYASYVLRPQAPLERVSALSLVVALAVADALERFGVPGVRLKWPNDLLLFDDEGAEMGKVAGILLEMSAQMDGVEYVIPGIGLNVNRPVDVPVIDDGGRRQAAYVSDRIDAVPRLAELAAAQIDCLAARYQAWKSAGCSFAPSRDEYVERLSTLGQDVRVVAMGGEVLASGIVIGIDDLGRLLVRDEDGTIAPVTAGEVSLRG